VPCGPYAEPENLLVDSKGLLKLCDFGFARRVDGPPKVRRCRLTLLKIALKAPIVSALEATLWGSAFNNGFRIQLALLHLGGRADGLRGHAVVPRAGAAAGSALRRVRWQNHPHGVRQAGGHVGRGLH